MDTIKPTTEPERLITRRHYRARYAVALDWRGELITMARGEICLVQSDLAAAIRRKYWFSLQKVQL